MTRRPADPLAPHLLRLGAGLAAGVTLDPGVIALDRCAAAGVRVPPGVVLIGAAYGGARATERPRDEAAMGADLGLSRVAGLVEVRLAAAPPAGPDGGYLAALRAGSGDGLAIARAVRELSAANPPGRGDVLVLAARPAIHAGTAVADPDDVDDDVVALEVTAEACRAPAGWRPRELRLPRLQPRRRAHRDVLGVPLPPWGMRLARQLRRVRQTLGADGWTIAWADDGRGCWVREAVGTTGGGLRR